MKKVIICLLLILVMPLFTAFAGDGDEAPGFEVTQYNIVKLPVDNDSFEIYVAFELMNVSEKPLSLSGFKFQYLDADGNPVLTKYQNEGDEPMRYASCDYPHSHALVEPGEKVYSVNRWSFSTQEEYDSISDIFWYDIKSDDESSYAEPLKLKLDVSDFEPAMYSNTQSVKCTVTNSTEKDALDIMTYVVLFDKSDKLIGVMDYGVGIVLPSGNSMKVFPRAILDISDIEGLFDNVGRYEGYSYAYEIDGESE